MRIKHVIWMLVLNAFLLLSLDVVMEYNDLSNRFQQVENTVSTAVESAVDISMASEEMFTDKFSEHVYSTSGSLNGGSVLSASSKLRVYRGGNWITGSAYIMSFFFNDKGRFPRSQEEYDNYESNYDDIWSVYERLFGEAGECYTNSSLSWASTNKSTVSVLESVLPSTKMCKTSLTANPEFLEFYKKIGYKVRTYAPVKSKVGSSFEVKDIKDIFSQGFPTLAQMGLDLGNDPKTGINFNRSTSPLSTNNFCMSIHAGKREDNNGYVTSKSVYFLTPYSLGVTYIPKEVVKPSFLSSLEQIIRFSKVKSGNVQDASFSDNYSSADGCIESTVYDGGTIPRTHSGIDDSDYIVDSGSPYINDGYAEYNMDSVKVRIDYFDVDFGSTSNATIVNRILGATSAYEFDGTRKHSYNLSDITQKVKDTDTGLRYLGTGAVSSNRLVARVTFKIKLQVPFKSGILQWARYLEDSDAENHFGIRGLSGTTGRVDITDDSEDGIWYQYTTYRSVSR